MDEFDPDPPDAREPLTPIEASRATETTRNVLVEMVRLADAYAQATSRIAILESENHDLRVLLAIRDEEGARNLLDEIARGATIVRNAVAALETAAPPSRKLMQL